MKKLSQTTPTSISGFLDLGIHSVWSHHAIHNSFFQHIMEEGILSLQNNASELVFHLYVHSHSNALSGQQLLGSEVK